MSVPAQGTTVDVSIVIVVYRTPEFLERCLQSIAGANLALTSEVHVLDNAPLDERSREICAAAGASYRRNEKNLGFGRAVNQGIDAARGRYVLVLNPDVEVAPGSIETLVAYADAEPDAGLVAPRLHYPDGSLQLTCRTFYTLPIFILRRTFLGKLFPQARIIRQHLMLDWDHESSRDVDWCIGGALLARTSAIADVGKMDERFFLYFEDVDWCYRMHQRGWRVVYHPASRMIHHYQRASAGWKPSRGLWLHLASTVRFYEKWSFVLYWVKLRSTFLRRAAFFGVDLAMVVLAFVVAYALRYFAADLLTKPLFSFDRYSRFLAFAAVVAMGSFASLGHYRERF
ncbi:MAG: glycosyltransferase family 2 protein, partial [Candidatus Eisenbacteria bacterium]|nr:glycosyltransferase family 2 protein [Candidatus Eisenbacteria bacterium]